ncbi:DEAD/DEAH box helicase [Bacillus sp. Marseille-Q1617]|uniref:DEAD/DEAH box helicase n=1 Tax=Bacillus sp. Marseille-Q1617 TaxID=2736887 RepID=UPI00158E8666|nr:DEAD/DEAH box helicase [Bacillus sp. Marseille-Q1617]
MMSFFIPGDDEVSYNNTIDLFNKLGKLDRLSHQQGESLKEYEEMREKVNDFAIEMPAGHGKTLVGGLIGEFNRINNSWRIVYACATRQLASQTNMLLKSYGIQSVLLTGKTSEFSQRELGKYQRSAAICVTTYGHIFNINPKFHDANQIIFDDAHATEYAIDNFWSVQINRQKDEDIFNNLFHTLGDSISPHIQDKIIHGTYDPLYDGIDILSFAQWYKKVDDIRSLLDTKTDGTSHYYKWSMLRSHLHTCQIFISHSQIVIKPILPPNKKHPAFIDAKERIYMSATLGYSGELERMFGVQDIHYIRKFPPTSNKVSGRRLILFPQDHFEGEKLNEVIKETIENQPRTLVLAPSFNEIENMKEELNKLVPNSTILDGHAIEDDLNTFTSTNNSILALAGRYEGIDLKDDDCRLQIMNELPVAISYEEKFLQDRLNATELLKSKLMTRIIQGLGRCTRGISDYAVVLFKGRYVGDYLFKEEFRKGLPAEIDAEISFGISQINHITDKDTWHSSLSNFYSQNKNWERVEAHLDKQINKLSKEKEDYTQSQTAIKLYNSTKSEIDYLYHLWEHNYEQAHKSAQGVLDEFARIPELKGYRAWWNYLIATLAVLQEDNDKVESYLMKSLQASENKVWLDKRNIELDLEDEEVYSDELETQIERISSYLKSFGDRENKFDKDLRKVIDGLNQKDANSFETALQSLGNCLGLYSERPEGHGAPDGVWNLTNTWISFEAKTNVESSEGYIPLDDIRQTVVHRSWIKQNYKLEDENQITLVMICPKSKIEQFSKHASEGIYSIKPEVIQKIAAELELILREGLQKIKFGDPSSLRLFLANKLVAQNLDIEGLKSKLTQVNLYDLVH